MARQNIPPERLRWKPDPETIPESSTGDITALQGTIGDETARQALRYAILSAGPQQHVFLRGPNGSRRRKLIEHVFEDLEPGPRQCRDFCFVHNFLNPDRPRLITLPGGQGLKFQQHMHRFGLFVKERLPEILANEPIRGRRETRKLAADREVRMMLKPFQKKLEKDGLGLIHREAGPASRLEIGVLVMDKAVTQEEFADMVVRKQVTAEENESINRKLESHQQEFQDLVDKTRQIWNRTQHQIEQMDVDESARLLEDIAADISRKFSAPGVEAFLRDIIDDVLEKRVGHDTRHLADPTMLYSVQVLRHDTRPELAPMIWPNQISAGNLFGSVDPAWRRGERAVASFRGIHAGALIEADGGFLVLDAEDLVDEPRLFRHLLRSLRARSVEIHAPAPDWFQAAQSLKPEPVPVDCCVILFGDERAYRKLAEMNDEFQNHFRVLADVNPVIRRDAEAIERLSRLLSAFTREESLLPLDRSGISAAIEFCARHSEHPASFTVDPGQLAALVREASFLAEDKDSNEVSRDFIEQAIDQARRRAGVRYHQFLNADRLAREGIQARGRAAGRCNAMLLHVDAGVEFSLPASMSATVTRDAAPVLIDPVDDRSTGPSSDWLVAMLGELLQLEQVPPVRVTLSTTHIHDATDMPAAMLSQACALIALLAGLPLRQDLALAGRLDASGLVRPVRHINERIEGFFDVCSEIGISGQQGMVIPRRCIDQLVVDQRVVSACTNDTFMVHAVDNIGQALELLTGQRAGTWRDGQFTEDSVFARAREQILEL